MHKTLPGRLLAGAFSFSLVGLALSPFAAPAALATNAASVSTGASELRVDTGSTAGAFSNPYFGANVAADSHGHVFAAYTDVRDGGTSVYVNRSSDYGGSYAAADVRVDRASGAGTASAIGAGVATDGAGTVYVTWPDTRGAGHAQDVHGGVARLRCHLWYRCPGQFGRTAGRALGRGLVADHKGDVYVAWTDRRTTATSPGHRPLPAALERLRRDLANGATRCSTTVRRSARSAATACVSQPMGQVVCL
ncbi:MAG: hypothetical protein U0514_03465 [Candidatus Andersenbacteria bacterium]